MSRFIALLIALYVVRPLTAQEPQIRTKLGSADVKVSYIGEKLTLVVELLVPGYFASAATFDLPDPSGLILMPPAEHPIVSSEEQSGTSYTIQRHEMWAFPERAGKQYIPSFKVRFAYKKSPLDKQEIATELQSTPLDIEVIKPPGTEELGTIISARELKAVEAWRPELRATAEVGNAFTRVITFTGKDIPGSLFPEFPTNQIEGLGIYSKYQLLDNVERGELDGKRETTLTYVCKRPGHYDIPAVQLSWWDLDSKSMQTVSFPTHSFEVVAKQNNENNSTFVDPKSSHNYARYIYSTIGLPLGMLLIWLAYRNLTSIQQLVKQVADPFRSVHLQPLNPNDGSSDCKD